MDDAARRREFDRLVEAIGKLPATQNKVIRRADIDSSTFTRLKRDKTRVPRHRTLGRLRRAVDELQNERGR